MLPGATIRNAIGAVDIAEIKIGDQVVIIGAPNGRGQIEAQFIRIMPSVTPATFLKIKKGNPSTTTPQLALLVGNA